MVRTPLRRFLVGVFVVTMTGGSAGVLWAQPPPAPERITDVRVTGLQRVSSEEVMKTIRLRRGDLFSFQAVDEDIRRLDKLGYFYPTGINVRREPYEGGLRLIFELKERPLISSLKFEGNRKFSDKKLRETVGLKQGAFVDFAGQKESTWKIEEMYREKRYQFVEVTREDRTDVQQNTVAITYRIKEGPRVTVKAIRFDGNKVFNRGRLLKQMETRTRKWVFWRQPFDESVWKFDLVRLRQFYKQNGYLDAVVSGDYQYSADKTDLTLVVKISEGVRYRIGDVTVRGQTITTGEHLRKQLKLRSGEEFSTVGYARDLDALRGFYTSRGYLDVSIKPKEVFPEPGRIDLVYNITENQQCHLGLLDFRGNFKTKDKVLRREFALFPGDVFNASEVDKGANRLRRLRYFNTVESSIVPGETIAERNLIVEVEEGQTGNLLFGAGLSSNHGVIGQFQLSFENFDIADCPRSLDDLLRGNAFVGAGQKLFLQWMPGTELQQARIFFSDPYFFDTRYSFSTDLYLYQRDRDDYDEDRIGVRLGLGRQVTERLSARLTFRLEGVDIDDVGTLAPDVLGVAGNNDIRSLAFNLTYDKTDDLWQPSRGYRVSGTAEVAGDYLGSDWDFVKGVIDAAFYHKLLETRDGRKHVLAVRTRVGAVDAYGDDAMVPLFERFYAGGRNSVRGFDFRGLGPTQLGTEVGGEFTVIGNIEYLFPIWHTMVQGRPYEVIRGVLFCDIGQVAYTLDDIGDTQWRTSAGVGLRLHLPGLGGVPIALDWGFPISKEDEDNEQIFSFNIGTTF